MEIYKINAWSGNLESDKKKTRERQSLSFGNNNNNNNKAFKSQTSWGRQVSAKHIQLNSTYQNRTEHHHEPGLQQHHQVRPQLHQSSNLAGQKMGLDLLEIKGYKQINAVPCQGQMATRVHNYILMR